MTTIDTITDQVLAQYAKTLREVYGPRVERIMLYGSRARGDFRTDSDYDVAVFLTDITSRWEEMGKLAEIEMKVFDDTGEMVHAMPYPARYWNDPSSPLMFEIRRDGQDL